MAGTYAKYSAASNSSSSQTITGGVGVIVSSSGSIDTISTPGLFNVKSYGATGNGTTDDTTAIQNAINAAAGNTLYIPAGTYKITTTLTVNTEMIILGGGERDSILQWQGGASTLFHVTSSADNVEMHSITIDNTGTATIGIQLDCVRALITKVFSNPLVKFSSYMITTNTANTTYHMIFRDCALFSSSTAQQNPVGINLSRGHTMIVDGCMFSGLGQAVAVGQVSQNVEGCSVINSRFESFSGTGSDDPGSNTDIGINAINVSGLNVTGCNFEYDGDEGGGVTGQLCLSLSNVSGGMVSGNYMTGNGGLNALVAIASNACVGVVFEGNVFERFINNYAIIATGSGSVWANEIGKNAIGSSDGGTRGAFNNTFTPGITFGGAAVGLTYAFQAGTAQRCGSRIMARGELQLSALGSSTGSLLITGLPIASSNNSTSGLNNNFDTAGTVTIFDSTGVSGAIQMFLSNGGSTSMRMFYIGTGSQSEFQNSNFTSNTKLMFEINYEALDPNVVIS